MALTSRNSQASHARARWTLRAQPRGALPKAGSIPLVATGMSVSEPGLTITDDLSSQLPMTTLPGVPVCVVPFGRDQFEIARRVELAAAGTRLPASRLTRQRLRNKVEEAIAKRSGARRLAEAFGAAGGAAAAADAVEHLLTELEPLPPPAPGGLVSQPSRPPRRRARRPSQRDAHAHPGGHRRRESRMDRPHRHPLPVIVGRQVPPPRTRPTTEMTASA
jgi:hypothetical protein